MPILCSCDALSGADFRRAVEALEHPIREARSLGAAAGIVFRATHQRANADGSEKKNCNTCVAHIREIIVEEGLRPRSELDEKNARLAAAGMIDKCDDCTNCNCGVTLDLSPR